MRVWAKQMASRAEARADVFCLVYQWALWLALSRTEGTTFGEPRAINSNLLLLLRSLAGTVIA